MKAGRYAYQVGGAKRLLIAGGLCDYPDLYGVLEKSGGVVVGDDLCTGSRWFEGAVGDGDPIKALAARYLDRPICAAKHSTNTARGERVVELAKTSGADGVIFLLLKFCDPHAFDYPYMKEFLDRENIPNMLYEVEDQLPSEGQLQTRFETFIHML